MENTTVFSKGKNTPGLFVITNDISVTVQTQQDKNVRLMTKKIWLRILNK
jgi:hypothetical protein